MIDDEIDHEECKIIPPTVDQTSHTCSSESDSNHDDDIRSNTDIDSCDPEAISMIREITLDIDSYE